MSNLFHDIDSGVPEWVFLIIYSIEPRLPVEKILILSTLEHLIMPLSPIGLVWTNHFDDQGCKVAQGQEMSEQRGIYNESMHADPLGNWPMRHGDY